MAEARRTQPRAGTLGGLIASFFEPRRSHAAPIDDRPIIDQCRELMQAKAEGPVQRLSASILATFPMLEEAEKRAFFTYLTDELDLDAQAVADAAAAYGEAQDAATLGALLSVAEPGRQTLFRKMNTSDGATTALVRMRAELLRFMREGPNFRRIDLDLVHLFTSWFNRGFLVLERIDWATPARVLEKIIAYEAVHQINDWDDLRRRTEPADRRCYAYFHPRMPDEPLIFVEVALTQGVPESIQGVLAQDRVLLDAADADTAVFYSISNCQQGLAGISFGESLIKNVVADLSTELPGLKTFITLSPIPGFRDWLTGL
ncbi:MAG: malonyl-CoA decarboxylase family protein, partial [Pseudomonadota bacterium]